jgi:hypothetical protein
LSHGDEIDTSLRIVTGQLQVLQDNVPGETVYTWYAADLELKKKVARKRIRHTFQCDILIESDSICNGEFQSLDPQTVTRQFPSESRSGDHKLCEAAKGVLIRDHEGRGLVYDSVLVLCRDGRKGHVAQRCLGFVVFYPSDVGGFRELDLCGENTGVRDLLLMR